MTALILHMPTWMMIRVLGVASYLFLFAGVASGILQSMPGMPARQKYHTHRLHITANGIGLSLGILHGILLTVDPYMPFHWRELLIPFADTHFPVLDGLGTLALFGMLLLVLTSDIRHRLGRKLWHGVHLLAYPVFLAALVHGIGTGTDTRQPLVSLMYFTTALMVIALTCARLWKGGRTKDAHLARGGRPEARYAAPVQAEQRIPQRRLGP